MAKKVHLSTVTVNNIVHDQLHAAKATARWVLGMPTPHRKRPPVERTPGAGGVKAVFTLTTAPGARARANPRRERRLTPCAYPRTIRMTTNDARAEHVTAEPATAGGGGDSASGGRLRRI
ncbi:hypothetical protein EVAR_93042_1 [Eumeta japonica]|uniref:Uncharacterized protein n=1 Tax=Eumeta variegata TaxID=151549 RepID=A0A4C1TFT2_EUMVA|nr:hypothetical protein EVAR_93042_1 [Eumeta japonica]